MADPKNFARLVVPTVAPLVYADSNYFRLGRYIEADEKSIKPTKPKITKSEAKDEKKTAKEQSKEKKEAADAYKKSPSTAKKVSPKDYYDTTVQNSTNYKSKQEDVATSTSGGLLAYTDHDLQENIRGQVLQQYGQGQSTVVETNDVNLTVELGQYNVQAREGVFITGGVDGHPANIELTAWGYVKQKAYGNLDEDTYGDTYKKVHGNSTEYFYGDKWSLLQGSEEVIKMGTSTNVFLGLSTTFRLSVEFTFNFGLRFALEASGKVNLVFGGGLNLFGGWKMDVVLGTDSKTVLGTSIKDCLLDLKFVLGNDMKKVGGIDGKVCELSVAVETTKLKKEDIELVKGNFKVKMNQGDISNSDFECEARKFKAIL